jgi:hypothetical protein
MKKTSSVMALVLGLVLTATVAARAQSPAPAASKAFVNVSVGGQLRSDTFGSSSTFTLFNETATVASNQSIGRGFVFDIGGGYKLTDHFAVGAGLWTQNSKGTANLVASLPDPLVFNHRITVGTTMADQKQTDVGVNIQLMWMTPLTNKIDLTISGGPTIVHVSQDVASITVAPGTVNTANTSANESKTTAKAGNVGADVSYALTPRFGLGAFVRYAGGSVDLPSVSGLNVGGVQVGVGARIKF